MTNNARIGGILSVVGGGIGAFGALIMLLVILVVGIFGASYDFGYNYGDDYYFAEGVSGFFMIIYGLFVLLGLLVCTLAIIGGVYGIRRKNWGLALAGAIAAALAFFPCGVPAIIFTALGKLEFEGANPITPAIPRV